MDNTPKNCADLRIRAENILTLLRAGEISLPGQWQEIDLVLSIAHLQNADGGRVGETEFPQIVKMVEEIESWLSFQS